jgi:hypothetical protein
VPAPETTALIAEAVMSAGKISTFALAVVFAGERRSVVAKCKMPCGERFASASWCTTVKPGVVSAHEAEGHVTVARLRSTTLSARHQVVNRWDMQVQATFVKPPLREPVTFIRSDFLYQRPRSTR